MKTNTSTFGINLINENGHDSRIKTPLSDS